MIFKLTRRAPLQGSLGAGGMGVPVIDSNTLRQAALQNSWQRDQRVARRRLALRWALWWLWKYRYYLLAVCAVVAAYLFYRFSQAEQPEQPVLASPQATPAQPSELRLRIQPQLLEPSRSSSRQDKLPIDTPTPFQLKPETQLKIKETPP